MMSDYLRARWQNGVSVEKCNNFVAECFNTIDQLRDKLESMLRQLADEHTGRVAAERAHYEELQQRTTAEKAQQALRGVNETQASVIEGLNKENRRLRAVMAVNAVHAGRTGYARALRALMQAENGVFGIAHLPTTEEEINRAALRAYPFNGENASATRAPDPTEKSSEPVAEPGPPPSTADTVPQKASEKGYPGQTIEPIKDRDWPPTPRVHTLKCWRIHFDRILSGAKTAEVRKADRPFCCGDFLVLREYLLSGPMPAGEEGHYTGRQVVVRIKDIAPAGNVPGLQPGYALLSIEKGEPW